ncbi:MAG: hypothetical protein ABSD02_25465, partial [Steroidobacteraceae bacterium]
MAARCSLEALRGEGAFSEGSGRNPCRASAAKILSHLERAAPEQHQSELPLRKRGPPLQSSL